MSSRNNIRGSLWSKWDLHIHSPETKLSNCYNPTMDDKDVWSEFLDTIKYSDIRVFGITDYYSIDGYLKINSLIYSKPEFNDKIFFPNIEFRLPIVTNRDNEEVNIHVIFDNDERVIEKINGFLAKLKTQFKKPNNTFYYCSPDDLKLLGYEKATVALEDLKSTLKEVFGKDKPYLIAAASNGSGGIRADTRSSRKMWLSDEVDKECDLFFGRSKDKEYFLINDRYEDKAIASKAKPVISGSDCHSFDDCAKWLGKQFTDANGAVTKDITWIKADPTFKGLLMVLQEPAQRVFIGSIPPDLVRWANNATKIIDKIKYEPRSSLPPNQKWFSGEISFNPGLIAIIGNKGSGKSALSDVIGLLGASKNSKDFSFLSDKRFRKPKNNLAQHFEAELEFSSREPFRKCLNDDVKKEDFERVKYLPQEYIETICTEIFTGDETTFETELKNVIYSHVRKEKRFGQTSLDKLIEFTSTQKFSRIETLITNLRAENQKRSELDIQNDPSYIKSIEERIKKKKAEIDAHEVIKPKPLDDPNSSGTIKKETEEILAQIKILEDQLTNLEKTIREKEKLIEKGERKRAVAKRLLETINNFEKYFLSFQDTLAEDLLELGIVFSDIIQYKIDTNSLMNMIENESVSLNQLNDDIHSKEAKGLNLQKYDCENTINLQKAKLDSPNIEYQKSVLAVKEWEQKKEALVGDIFSDDSFEYLQYLLAETSNLPQRIGEVKLKQKEIAKEIFSEKVSLASLYQEMYAPVQEFINSHPIAREKLRLEFNAELMNVGFTSKIIPLIAQNKKGSFYGVEEGKKRLDSIVDSTNMNEWVSLEQFIDLIDESFHTDQRNENKPSALIAEQLMKGIKPVDVYNFIYSLEYLEPRYMLKWDGKELSMLSPGERGTLLLIFYLLIDKNDTPLIIDQPEGNLDNHTVAKILVDCIRYARQRRQVCIVTHNPNLAVVCDADQVIRATLDIENGNQITYLSGSLENPVINLSVTDILEGTRPAFNIRGSKYEIAE